MKKIISLAAISVLVLSMGLVAFADVSNEAPQWYNDMMDWRREQVQEAVDNGEITEEDAEYWTEEIDRMEEYHNEEGYGYGPGMMGRYGRRDSRRGNGFSGGFGPGHCHNW